MREYDVRQTIADDILRMIPSADVANDYIACAEQCNFETWRSGLKGDNLLWSVGITVLWRGRAECFALLSPSIGRYDLLWTHRRVEELIEQAHRDFQLRRLEANTRLRWPPGQRWLEMLGFEVEGILKQYSPDGADHIMMALTWPENSWTTPLQQSSASGPLSASGARSSAASPPNGKAMPRPRLIDRSPS